MFPRITRAAWIAGALLLALILATIAARPWTSQGRGTAVLGVQLVGTGGSQAPPGQVKDNGNDKSTFTISGNVTALYPGAHAALVLTIGNPNNFPIDVQTLAAAVQAPSPSGCPATTLSIGGFSGHLVVAGNGTAAKSLPVTMSAGAPNACQNVTFPLKFSGTAVKP
jgi:hypothetical protein